MVNKGFSCSFLASLFILSFILFYFFNLLFCVHACCKISNCHRDIGIKNMVKPDPIVRLCAFKVCMLLSEDLTRRHPK